MPSGQVVEYEVMALQSRATDPNSASLNDAFQFLKLARSGAMRYQRQ